jgi:hypothetical protein
MTMDFLGDLWLVDGYHRVAAAKSPSLATIVRCWQNPNANN